MAAACAFALLSGTAAALPEVIDKTGAAMSVSAEMYGDFEYTVLDDGTAEITKYNGTDAKVDIPGEIDGKKVTSIGGWAFQNCTS